MTTTWKVTESFGTEAEVERLKGEAIEMARATGSLGATMRSSAWSEDGNRTTIASVTVSKV